MVMITILVTVLKTTKTLNLKNVDFMEQKAEVTGRIIEIAAGVM